MKRPEKSQIRHHRNHIRVSSLTVGNHLACYGFHHCKRRFPQGSTRSCSLKHQRQVAYFFFFFMLLRRGAFLTCNPSRFKGVLRKTAKFVQAQIESCRTTFRPHSYEMTEVPHKENPIAAALHRRLAGLAGSALHRHGW